VNDALGLRDEIRARLTASGFEARNKPQRTQTASKAGEEVTTGNRIERRHSLSTVLKASALPSDGRIYWFGQELTSLTGNRSGENSVLPAASASSGSALIKRLIGQQEGSRTPPPTRRAALLIDDMAAKKPLALIQH
jgi:hypothetical protein